MMQTTQYLYNIDPKHLVDMPYQEALQYKAEMGRKLMKRLSTKARGVINDTTQYRLLLDRYLDVSKAVDHTQTLIEELLCEDLNQKSSTRETAMELIMKPMKRLWMTMQMKNGTES